jgi:ubiquinone/menaquinone biosynthesis C-methylase UbiE
MGNKVTRGKGLLENYLAKKRADKANSFFTETQRQGKILDIGCGSCPYFLINTRFQEKYGIDPSIKATEVKKVILKKMKATDQTLPFEDNFFDVVTMLAVFEHIEKEKVDDLLKEVKRVLKKEGLLVITTPSPWVDSLLHMMGRVGLISSEEIEDHKHNHERVKIEGMLEKAGFKNNMIRSGFFEIFANMWFSAIK